MNIIIYEVKSGQITRSVTCPDNAVPLQYNHETENFLEHDRIDDALFYVHNGQVEPRPEFQEVISGTVITGLPNPTTVATNGITTIVTDGEADLTFEHNGVYMVQLYSFPYVDKMVEVTQS